MISWKTVEDEAGLVKREAGPMYKSKGCTIVFPRKYSALNTDLELKLLLFLDHACLL